MLALLLLGWEPYTGDVSGLPYQVWPKLDVPTVGLLYEATSATFGATPQLPATPQHTRPRSNRHVAFSTEGSSPVMVDLPAEFRPSSSALVVRLTAASAEPGPRVQTRKVEVLHDAAPALAAARARFEEDLAAAPMEDRTRQVCARRPVSGSPPPGAYDERTRRYDPLTTWASLPTWRAADKRLHVTFVARRLEQLDFLWTTAAGCLGDAPCAQDPGGEFYFCGAELRATYEVDLRGNVKEREVVPITEVWHATRAP
jgi:hypothetical protein